MTITTIATAIWLVLAPAAVAAAPGEDVPVPGGISSMAGALGIRTPPDRARFLAEIARMLYAVREGYSEENDARLVSLRTYLDGAKRETADTVPVPLAASVWSDAIFHRPVTAPMLFAAIMLDRRAALLAHGLAALDDETLRYLADHPSLLSRLYKDSAASFATFGDGLRIHGGRVVPPGGTQGQSVWESVLGESATNPERFVPRVFGASEGRVALIYAALAHLDAPHVAFALGSWLPNRAEGLSQFERLIALSEARREWVVDVHSFSRPVHDVTQLLTRVRVQPNGAPAPPSTRQFWQAVFDTAAVDDNVVMRTTRTEAAVDAGWLAAIISVNDPRARANRLAQLSFAQRVFAATPVSQLPDAVIAARALPRFSMLMLTLERIGVRDPRVYAAAARQASQMTSLAGRRGFAALGQFQGGLALIDRLVRVHSLTVSAAEALVVSAASVTLRQDGTYHGGIARWIDRALAPALKWAPNADVDVALVASLAGIANPGTTARPISWEGRTYRIDLVATERARLTRVREKMRSPWVRDALELEHAATLLSSKSRTTADVEATTAALLAIRKSQPGVSMSGSLERTAARLSKIAQHGDLRNAAVVAETIFDLSDELLAQALVSLLYALDLGDPEGTAMMGGDVGQRHDFGLAIPIAEMRIRTAWAEPKSIAVAGAPWHVQGSLLGLDVALSPVSLIRIDAAEMPPPPALATPDRDVFIKTIALINPFDLSDTSLDAIVAALDRGRSRVAQLSSADASWDQAADEIRMDGWRRRAGRWALAHDAAVIPSLFSLTELIWLGGPAPDPPLDQWGMARLASDACLCTMAPRLDGVQLASGRESLGLLATELADINLRIAERLGRLRLPASLARGVLVAAVQDFIDRVPPLYPNDWLTFARFAQAIPDDRIDDYIARLAADGPLIEDQTTAVAAGEGR